MLSGSLSQRTLHPKVGLPLVAARNELLWSKKFFDKTVFPMIRPPKVTFTRNVPSRYESLVTPQWQNWLFKQITVNCCYSFVYIYLKSVWRLALEEAGLTGNLKAQPKAELQSTKKYLATNINCIHIKIRKAMW